MAGTVIVVLVTAPPEGPMALERTVDTLSPPLPSRTVALMVLGRSV